jgi:hypothetical protein
LFFLSCLLLLPLSSPSKGLERKERNKLRQISTIPSTESKQKAELWEGEETEVTEFAQFHTIEGSFQKVMAVWLTHKHEFPFAVLSFSRVDNP